LRSTNGSVAPYSPDPVPADLPDSARRYLDAEFHRIAALFQILQGGMHLDVSYSVPPKARAGDIVRADGVQWNPGSGEGIYYLNGSGTWKPLG
jgi:hypothetical protein